MVGGADSVSSHLAVWDVGHSDISTPGVAAVASSGFIVVTHSQVLNMATQSPPLSAAT